MFTELFFNVELFDGETERVISWREVRETDSPVNPDAISTEMLEAAKATYKTTLGTEEVRGRHVQAVTVTIGTTSLHAFR